MAEWIIQTISSAGYLGVLFLMFAENIFPPIPSELIMPFAGFAAARGDLNPALVLLSGTLGAVLGSLPWYFLGVYLSKERLHALISRYGRWLTVSMEEVERWSLWLRKYGAAAITLGRLLPTARTLISVPAGIIRMPLKAFLFYTTSGTLLWTGALMAGGYLLESRYDAVEQYVDPVAKAVLFLIVGTYLYRFFILSRRTTSERQ